jgi:hypothetical protein
LTPELLKSLYGTESDLIDGTAPTRGEEKQVSGLPAYALSEAAA